MRHSSVILLALPLAVSLAPTAARADDLGPDGNDYGKVTRIRAGVWEADVGALAVLAFDKDGDAQTTRLSGDVSIGVQRFVRDNFSVGVAFLANYVNDAESSAIQLGGALLGTLHWRLGQGAFLRPQLALGVLGSQREIPMADQPNLVEEVPQIAGVARVRLALAYFASRNWVLEAGPQINTTVGTYQPSGADRHTYTQVSGGFSIGVGRAW